ncbi:hypothetical protein [Leuconostoc pseudomesenteroides]|uniref:hypothetical protein n=1 Tax=Leuconostoc pseudomesenteroides TaxID=33968 RepID=UPI002286113B|nr:hypothetical protein [Leuconostoc pseudomesenteroides]WAM37867.1 hypothetical protein OYT93_06570 [Leuconostoc pseudomesenteroides]
MNGNFDFEGTIMTFKGSEKYKRGLEKNVYFDLVNYNINQDIATADKSDYPIFQGKLTVEISFGNLKASREPQLAVLEAIGKLIDTGKAELEFSNNDHVNPTQSQ